jgi:hypothetical protein
MPWKKILIPMILFVVLVQSAPSTTIDELFHPLLRYKQFKLSPGFKLYSTEYFCIMARKKGSGAKYKVDVLR